MTIYQVSYSRIDWNLYFSGYMQYHYTATKWSKNVCVKDPGAGKIEEIWVE